MTHRKSLLNSKQKRSLKARIERRDGPLCWICGLARGDTLDHIKPLSLGGGERIKNLRLACEPCNKQRGNQSAAQIERGGVVGG